MNLKVCGSASDSGGLIFTRLYCNMLLIATPAMTHYFIPEMSNTHCNTFWWILSWFYSDTLWLSMAGFTVNAGRDWIVSTSVWMVVRCMFSGEWLPFFQLIENNKHYFSHLPWTWHLFSCSQFIALSILDACSMICGKEDHSEFFCW